MIARRIAPLLLALALAAPASAAATPVPVEAAGTSFKLTLSDGTVLHSPDLVILDINMPGEDGLTLARRLREHSDLCIMMLTAAGETVDHC
jgi:DNA-binding response OmpR family regulator